MKVFNLHARQTPNVGDLNCGPAQYFPLGSAAHLDFEVPADAAVILGGGGLLHENFDVYVQKLLGARKLIVWGVGTNKHKTVEATYPEWFSKCDLVGVRDYGTSHRWVPCASAMHGAFGYMRQPTYRVVQYLHLERKPLFPLAMPSLSNMVSSMEEALNFLSSGEFVVTNTYHGAYWATLLGRRVIMYPFSSRHFHMKHMPVLARPELKLSELMAQARVYPEALEECRAANRAFHADVKRVLAA